MVNAGFRRGAGVPWAGTFLETNVRLYSVDEPGRRGIVFLSLDTNRSLIVAGARLGFGLPYRWARMRHTATADGAHRYTAQLRWPGARAASRIGIRVGAPRDPTALDTFLTARWGLHVRHLGRTFYVPNAHWASGRHHRRPRAAGGCTVAFGVARCLGSLFPGRHRGSGSSARHPSRGGLRRLRGRVVGDRLDQVS